MNVKAFNDYYNLHDKYELQELRNKLYDELVDQYQEAGILICDYALDEQVDELIDEMIEDRWEQFA